jgi:hypothetical protein
MSGRLKGRSKSKRRNGERLTTHSGDPFGIYERPPHMVDNDGGSEAIDYGKGLVYEDVNGGYLYSPHSGPRAGQEFRIDEGIGGEEFERYMQSLEEYGPAKEPDWSHLIPPKYSSDIIRPGDPRIGEPDIAKRRQIELIMRVLDRNKTGRI